MQARSFVRPILFTHSSSPGSLHVRRSFVSFCSLPLILRPSSAAAAAVAAATGLTTLFPPAPPTAGNFGDPIRKPRCRVRDSKLVSFKPRDPKNREEMLLLLVLAEVVDRNSSCQLDIDILIIAHQDDCRSTHTQRHTLCTALR